MGLIIQVISGTLFLGTLLLYECIARGTHTEPIVSQPTVSLYSLHEGFEKYLSDLCDCSNVISCSCQTQVGESDLVALVTLIDKNIFGFRRSPDLEIKISVNGSVVFTERKDINDLIDKCSINEDESHYIDDQSYCIKFNVEQSNEQVKVCAEIRMHDTEILDKPLLCVRKDLQQ